MKMDFANSSNLWYLISDGEIALVVLTLQYFASALLVNEFLSQLKKHCVVKDIFVPIMNRNALYANI